eukprot:15452028-Alexandrium_andersonii.AAC.1
MRRAPGLPHPNSFRRASEHWSGVADGRPRDPFPLPLLYTGVHELSWPRSKASKRRLRTRLSVNEQVCALAPALNSLHFGGP